MLQLTRERPDHDAGAYLEVIAAKTAALFAAAAEIGAVVAAGRRRRRRRCDSYGRNLGIAFQLVDDALDYSADAGTLGKNVGDDFREGKITLPVLLAFERGTEAERGFWRRVLEERDQGPDDLAEAQRLIAKHRALHDTVERARLYGDQALAALQSFPDGPERRALADIVEFCIARAR